MDVEKKKWIPTTRAQAIAQVAARNDHFHCIFTSARRHQLAFVSVFHRAVQRIHICNRSLTCRLSYSLNKLRILSNSSKLPAERMPNVSRYVKPTMKAAY